MNNRLLFSIIIPVRIENSYLKETIKHLNNQSEKSFELLVITDKLASLLSLSSKYNIGPSAKRNLGAKIAKGKYLAFIDDDSYPNQNWLKNALIHLNSAADISAVCGPSLTPPSDNVYQQASGLVWSSWFGAGGAGIYRNRISKPRFVDDFPSVNLIVNKADFDKIGGFNEKYWPGEDTLLCLSIVNSLNKKIYYHPSIVVYHHRRQVIIPHLQQIRRYAIHRGYFAKKYPKNSLKIGYITPSIFVIYLLLILPILYLFPAFRLPILMPLATYIIILISNFVYSLHQNRNLPLSIYFVISLPLTHIYYGIFFPLGYFSSDLSLKLHKVNTKTGNYLGG